jgi:hypothetical protein
MEYKNNFGMSQEQLSYINLFVQLVTKSLFIRNLLWTWNRPWNRSFRTKLKPLAFLKFLSWEYGLFAKIKLDRILTNLSKSLENHFVLNILSF